MTQAKRVLTYLYTTKHKGITYGNKIHGIIGHNIIHGYADADFATDLDNLRGRCTETSSSRRSARSRLWRAVGILRRFLTGGVVARALWKSAHPTSGISCTEKENVFET